MDKFIEYIMVMSNDDKKKILDALLTEQNGIKTIENKNGYKEAFEIARKTALGKIKDTIEYYKIDLLIHNREKAAWREAAYFVECERYVASIVKSISFEEYCKALKDPDFNNPDIPDSTILCHPDEVVWVKVVEEGKKYKNDNVCAAERIYAQIIWNEKYEHQQLKELK